MHESRLHFQDELRRLEEQALGGLDMVSEALERALDALERQDLDLAAGVVADDDRTVTSRCTRAFCR